MKKIVLLFALIAMVFSFPAIQAQDLESILGQVSNSTDEAFYKSSYFFDIHIQLEVSDMGDDLTLYEGYLSRDGLSTAIIFTSEGEKTTVILDGRNKSVLILSDSEEGKNGIALALDPDALSAMAASIQEEVEYDSYDKFKTGKTKVILGYLCEEYLIRENGTLVQMWSSPELGDKVDKTLITNQQVFGGAFIHAAGTEGLVLEYHYKNEDSGDQRIMKIKKIDFGTEFIVKPGSYSIMTTGMQ